MIIITFLKKNGASLEFYACNSISFDKKWVLGVKFGIVGKDAEYMHKCMYVFMYDVVLLSMYTCFFKYVGNFRVTN